MKKKWFRASKIFWRRNFINLTALFIK